MSENKKQGNAQIPREAIKGAAGLGAEKEFDLGMIALQEEKGKGKIVVTNIQRCTEPIKAMSTPDFSNVKVHDGGLNDKKQKNSERGE